MRNAKKENGKAAEKKSPDKKEIAREIINRVKTLNSKNTLLPDIYRRGFFDMARYLNAGGNWPELCEILAGKTPETMRNRRGKKPL
jgi:hypothetical protein